jgi:uncharacterized membrane protein
MVQTQRRFQQIPKIRLADTNRENLVLKKNMTNSKCPQCGLTNWASSEICKRCQFRFKARETTQLFDSQLQNKMPPNEPQYYSNQLQIPNESQQYLSSQSPISELKQGMAIASMVVGIMGCFITAIPGLILSIISFKKAKNEPYTYGGKGFAIAGICLNGIQLAIAPIVIISIYSIANTSLHAARVSANEASAIATLRTIHDAEVAYIKTTGLGYCGDLNELEKGKFINEKLSNGNKNGYFFLISKTMSRVHKGSVNCEVSAIPVYEDFLGESDKTTGTHSFYMGYEDQWKIRYSTIPFLHADSEDPTIERYDTFQP